jgi:choline-glycine betaine transporter
LQVSFSWQEVHHHPLRHSVRVFSLAAVWFFHSTSMGLGEAVVAELVGAMKKVVRALQLWAIVIFPDSVAADAHPPVHTRPPC